MYYHASGRPEKSRKSKSICYSKIRPILNLTFNGSITLSILFYMFGFVTIYHSVIFQKTFYDSNDGSMMIINLEIFFIFYIGSFRALIYYSKLLSNSFEVGLSLITDSSCPYL